MSRFGDYLGSQCSNPRGIIGSIMTWGMNRVNNVMYKGIVNEIDIHSNTTMLDIGFGNGYLEEMIYKKNKCSIYGIDISQDMVDSAVNRNKQGVSDGKIHLTIGDCCNLSFDDNSFDIITSMNTIYFWESTMKGMQEIYRTLKDQGIFCNAVLSKEALKKVFYTKNGFKLFDKEDYISLGKKAGFKDIYFKELKKGYCFLVIYKK